MKTNPANILLNKLMTTPKEHRTHFPKTPYVECFLNFEKYLEQLCTKHLRKRSYSKEHIVAQIFQRTIPTRSWRTWNKNQLFAAYQSCIRLRETMTVNKQFNPKGIKNHEFLIRNLIYDLKPFIELLESTDAQPFVLFNGGKSNVAHSWENYHFTRQLYFNSVLKDNYIDSKTAFIATAFILRHTIEVKMKRIIGFENAFNEKGKSAKLKHEFMFDFIKENESHFQYEGFDFPTVKQVFQWCNVAVHNGIMPRLWEMETAIDYCRPLFAAKKSKTEFNVDGAIRVTNLAALRVIFENTVNSKFPSEKYHYEWSSSTESVIVS